MLSLSLPLFFYFNIIIYGYHGWLTAGHYYDVWSLLDWATLWYVQSVCQYCIELQCFPIYHAQKADAFVEKGYKYLKEYSKS